MRMARATEIACLALLIGLVLPATPAHAQYPPCTASGQVSRTNVQAGQTVVFSGSGFTPGALITIAFDGEVIDTATADGTGAFSVTVTIPGDAGAGDHTLTATGPRSDDQACPNGEDPAVLGVLIVRATVVVSAGGLVGTGSNSTIPLVLAGSALVLIGAATVVVARRRRQSLAAA